MQWEEVRIGLVELIVVLMIGICAADNVDERTLGSRFSVASNGVGSCFMS